MVNFCHAKITKMDTKLFICTFCSGCSGNHHMLNLVLVNGFGNLIEMDRYCVRFYIIYVLSELPNTNFEKIVFFNY